LEASKWIVKGASPWEGSNVASTLGGDDGEFEGIDAAGVAIADASLPELQATSAEPATAIKKTPKSVVRRRAFNDLRC